MSGWDSPQRYRSETIDLDFNGPVFTGWNLIIDQFSDEIREEVAYQALADVQDILNARIKRPTPYYETQIRVTYEEDLTSVDDRGIVYGPWLEGISRRNSETSFKGYHAFLKATALVKTKLNVIMVPIIARYIRRLNGS